MFPKYYCHFQRGTQKYLTNIFHFSMFRNHRAVYRWKLFHLNMVRWYQNRKRIWRSEKCSRNSVVCGWNIQQQYRHRVHVHRSNTTSYGCAATHADCLNKSVWESRGKATRVSDLPFKAWWLLYVPPGRTLKDSTRFSRCVYVFCADLRTNGDFTLYNINRMASYNGGESVYCAVRTASLNKTDIFRL